MAHQHIGLLAQLKSGYVLARVALLVAIVGALADREFSVRTVRLARALRMIQQQYMYSNGGGCVNAGES